MTHPTADSAPTRIATHRAVGEARTAPGPLGSMRVRIVLAMVVLLAGAAAVSIFVVRAQLVDRLDEEVRVGLEREAEEFELITGGLNPRTGRPFGNDLPAVFDLYFEREVPDEGETLLAFVDGRLYRSERAARVADNDRIAGAITYWLSRTEREAGDIDTPAGHTRYVVLPLDIGPGGHFVAANFPALERDEINDAVRTQALTQFVTILVASLAGLLLAGRVLRPLRNLADTATSITESDLTRRIPVRGNDEASRIARAFNEMLERIAEAFGAQRQFLDDASHELRSPLTVIRGHVELLDLDTDPAERDETIRIITAEIERMNLLVEDLLLLARAEHPGFLTLAAVDVTQLTAEFHAKAAVLCDRPWSITESAAAVVWADPQRLTQAWMQLAQNACDHTPAGQPVRIGSRVAGGELCLWVQDAGPGVSEQEARRIFERLAKGSSREGTGLGLSIVAAIAEAHGGRAHVAPTRAPGARFEILIPADLPGEAGSRAGDPAPPG